jgi:hypothetical protein
MANQNKFEQMLEKLVNEDKAGAEELFHEIVVEKSRDIYESLLESDLDDEEVDEATDEEVDETTDEEVDETTDEEVDESDDEELDEDFNLDEFEVEADPMDAMMGDMEVDGGDEAPAMDMDMDSEEGEAEVEDRVEDLEDALDELKAEFEKMMSGDDEDEGEDDGEEDPMDMDMDAEEEPEEEAITFETTDEEVDEAADEEVEEAEKSETETMREYVEKVTASMGDNGVNTKSSVATPNNMGGDASNLVQGGEADTKGTTGGLAANTSKEDNAGNVNVPGGKASKSLKGTKGHGAEKKGKELIDESLTRTPKFRPSEYCR